MPVQLTLLCGMPRTFRIAQGWGPNPSPGCLHFIILVALFYFQRFPQSIPCVKKSQFGQTYLSLTQGVTGVLLSPRPFFSPGSGGGCYLPIPTLPFSFVPASNMQHPVYVIVPLRLSAARLVLPSRIPLRQPGVRCYSDNSPPMHPLWYQYCLFFILICRYKSLLYAILPSHLPCLIPSIFSAESNIPCRALNTTAPSHSPCPHQLLNFQILKYTMDSP